jgi:hypothetical protein
MLLVVSAFLVVLILVLIYGLWRYFRLVYWYRNELIYCKLDSNEFFSKGNDNSESRGESSSATSVVSQDQEKTILKNWERIKRVFPGVSNAMGTPIPPPWFYNCHMQLIPFIVQSRILARTHPVNYQNYDVPTYDGLDTVRMRIYPTFEEVPERLPIVIVLPGLRAEAQDFPGNTLIRRIVRGQCFDRSFFGRPVYDTSSDSYKDKGYKMRAVLFLNRGHEMPCKAPYFSIHGQVEDLEEGISKLKTRFPGGTKDVKWFMVSMSAGCGLHANATGMWDSRRSLLEVFGKAKKNQATINVNGYNVPREVLESIDPPPCDISGSIYIVPGFDIKRCWGMFLPPYCDVLLGTTREFYVGRNEKVLREFHGDDLVDEAMTCKTLQDFFNACWKFDACATRNGEGCLEAESSSIDTSETSSTNSGTSSNRPASKTKQLPLQDSFVNETASKTSRTEHLPFYLRFGLRQHEEVTSMDEWFDKGNPGPWICRATHPSVAIVAEDDPICVPENFRTVSEHYPHVHKPNKDSSDGCDGSEGAAGKSEHRTYADYFSSFPTTIGIVATPSGSHCPFLTVPRRRYVECQTRTGGCSEVPNESSEKNISRSSAIYSRICEFFLMLFGITLLQKLFPCASQRLSNIFGQRIYRIGAILELFSHYISGVFLWPLEKNDGVWMLPNWAEEYAVRFCEEVLKDEQYVVETSGKASDTSVRYASPAARGG